MGTAAPSSHGDQLPNRCAGCPEGVPPSDAAPNIVINVILSAVGACEKAPAKSKDPYYP